MKPRFAFTWVFAVGLLLTGCISPHPVFSAKDGYNFAEPPKVVKVGDNYVLAWKYAESAFAFIPDYFTHEGKLVFYLPVTLSNPAGGRMSSWPIVGAEAVAAIEKGEVYWWEPDGSYLKLEIITAGSNNNKGLPP